MAKGISENILEIILDKKNTENFKIIDDNLAKIKERTRKTSERMAELVQSLDKLGGTLNGSVNTGFEKLSSGFDRLNEAIGKMGSNSKSSLETTANETNKFINELNRLINGSESKKKSGEKSILDGLLFDTKELEDKRNKFAALISELESKAVSKGGRLLDTEQLISTGGTDAMKRLNVIIDNLRASIKNTQADLENTTKKFYGGGAEFKYKELEKVEMAYARLTTRITDLRGKLQTATSLQPIIQELNSIRTEYTQVTGDLNTFVQKNKKLQDAEKNIKAYTDRIAEIENAFKRLTLSGGAFTKNGSMTKEAKALTDEKTMLEERIRLMRMTTDEAIKNEQRITAETEKQNAAKLAEFQKLYAERLALEKKSGAAETNRQLRDKQNLATDNEVRLLEVYSSRMREIDSIIKDLSKKYPELAKKAKEAYDIKSVEASVKEEERRADAIERVTKAQERQKMVQEKINAKSFDAKLGITEEPNTIEQYRIAIANLKKELSKTPIDDKGAIANTKKKMDDYKKKLQEVEGEQKKVQQSTQRMNISLQQVASAFGIYFSVQSLVNFGQKIVEITGEFEMQHRAMQAIIGDTQEADKLWEETVALAVKSPYRVKDLVTYTKQLAAYRIETDKLYETNKMLADISSGLGVDMNRLILAYGQVKAANYLRGQELRQFSEAGVNILGELAKYFEELEGRAVSTGEVFDRVSKRMVSFEDVSEVLRRLTEEGGMFYKMQEIQSETLQGKIMNLRDSFDLFLNSIGESKRDLFMTVVETLKSLMDNWQKLENVIRATIGLFTAYKIVQISAAANMIKAGTAASVEELSLGRLSSKIVQLITNTNQASAANLRFANSMKAASKANIWIAAITAVLAITRAIVRASKERNELDVEISKINREMNKDANKMVTQYQKLASEIKKTSTSEEERVKLLAKMKNAYGEILPEKMTNIEYITKEGNSYDEAAEKIKKYYNELRKQRAIEKTEEKYGGYVDEATTRLAEDISKIVSKSQGIDVDVLSVTQALDKFAELLSQGKVENAVDDFNRIFREMTGVQLTMKEWTKTNASAFSATSGFALKFDTFARSIEQYNDKMRIATERTNNYTTTIEDMLESDVFEKGNLMMEQAFAESVEKGEVDNDLNTKMEFFGENAAKYFKLAFNKSMNEGDSIFDGLGFGERDKYKTKFFDILPLKVDEKQMTLAQKTISNIVSGIEKKYSLSNDQESLLNQIVIGREESNTEFYERAKRKLEGWLKDIVDMENKMTENNPMLSDPSMKKAIEEYLKEIKRLAGEKDKGGSSGGNPALERLNKQISAIKEANAQYKKYLELFDDTTAFGKVRTEFADLFDDLGMKGWVDSVKSFSDEEVKGAFEDKLKPFVTAAGEKGKQAADKFITEWQYKIDKGDFDEVLKDITEKMDGAFAEYEMSSELQKMGFGGELIKELFNITPISLDGLKSYLDEIKMQIGGAFTEGTGMEEWYGKQVKKINEMQLNELKESMKRIAGYIKNSYDQIIYEQQKGMYDISFGEQLFKEGKISSEQFVQLVRNISKDVNDAVGKIRIDAFKDTDTYIAAMGNLSAYTSDELEKLSTALKNLISQNSGQMTAEEMEKYYDSLEKVTKKINELNKGAFEDNVIEKVKKIKEIEERINEIREKRNEIISKQNELEGRIEFYQRNADMAEDEGDQQYWLSMIVQGNQEAGLLQSLLNQCSAEMGQLGAEMGEFGSMAGDAAGTIMIIDAIIKGVNQSIIAATKLFEDIKEMAESFGSDTESGGWRESSNFFNTLSEFNENAYQGWEDLKNGNIAGAIQNTLSSIINLIKNANKWIDSGYQEQIEKNEKTISALEKGYDRLQKGAEKAWDTENLVRYNRQMKENLEMQLRSYEAMIDAEEQKKNADRDQIDEWKQNIADLRNDMEEQQDRFIEQLGGIGEANYLSATEDFVGAWLEAFKETGDGMGALGEHFDELIENMVKKQAVLKVTERFLAPLYGMIDNMLEDGNLTTSEVDALRDKLAQVAPELNAALESIFGSLGLIGDNAESDLTGLQRGIQGVTEQTAEIIAAYMNSLRFYSIDSNTQIRRIASIISDNTGQANPMLAELRNIANRADDIYNFLYQRRENGTDSIRVTVVG